MTEKKKSLKVYGHEYRESDRNSSQPTTAKNVAVLSNSLLSKNAFNEKQETRFR